MRKSHCLLAVEYKKEDKKSHAAQNILFQVLVRVLFTLPQLLLTTVPKGQAAIYTSALLPGLLFLLGYLKSTQVESGLQPLRNN